jgi:Protein of unknown function (DUF2442)
MAHPASPICRHWPVEAFFLRGFAPGFFDRVRVTDLGAVEWPEEIDLCPDALYLQVTGKSPEDVFPALQARLAHA